MTITDECVEALKAAGCAVWQTGKAFHVLVPASLSRPDSTRRELDQYHWRLLALKVHQETPHRCRAQ